MDFLYGIGIFFSRMVLHILALFNSKIRRFVSGRKNVIPALKSALNKNQKVIWIHAASLGEYEQGVPVMEEIKLQYPEHLILLTFFSPSGYEVQKDSNLADVVCYLPLDSRRNSEAFLNSVQPVLSVFIKYEIWPNYLKSLEERQIPALLISAIFSERQVFFKWYGGFMRKALGRFDRIFVQNKASEKLLSEIGITDTEVSGDTRYDRVSKIRENGEKLSFMDAFKGDELCFVAGSTWPEDEEILINFINKHKGRMKFVIAPHNIKADHIKQLQKKLRKKNGLYSEKAESDLKNIEVLIVDTIGLLTRIYAYADISYVGGGFSTGLHNTLEPAVFGIPVIIGPDYHKFQEAMDLVHRKGILVVRNEAEFSRQMQQLTEDEEYRKNTGLINSDFISSKRGASIQIIAYIRTLL